MDVQEGWNHFNGEQALAFSRERKNLPDGDNQRGIHQQAVITAMLKKVLSPTMLLKANSILNQVSLGCRNECLAGTAEFADQVSAWK